MRRLPASRCPLRIRPCIRRAAVDRNRLEVGVTGDEEVAIERLEEVGAGLQRVGPGDEAQQRVLRDFVVTGVEEEGHAGGRLRDHANATIDDGVLHEAFTREGLVIARRPDGLTQRLEGDEGAGGGGFLGGRCDYGVRGSDTDRGCSTISNSTQPRAAGALARYRFLFGCHH